MPRDLSKIFKAYDVRGVYPGDLDEDVAARVGEGLVRFTGSDRVVVGRDMRTSSGPLAEAFAREAAAAGGHVGNGHD